MCELLQQSKGVYPTVSERAKQICAGAGDLLTEPVKPDRMSDQSWELAMYPEKRENLRHINDQRLVAVSVLPSSPTTVRLITALLTGSSSEIILMDVDAHEQQTIPMLHVLQGRSCVFTHAAFFDQHPALKAQTMPLAIDPRFSLQYLEHLLGDRRSREHILSGILLPGYFYPPQKRNKKYALCMDSTQIVMKVGGKVLARFCPHVVLWVVLEFLLGRDGPKCGNPHNICDYLKDKFPGVYRFITINYDGTCSLGSVLV